METRKITIANTRDQKKSVIMTAATTLGELKRDLDAAGINYAEMDFIEAITKTQLRGDDSVLPHDVPFNHTNTNELVGSGAVACAVWAATLARSSTKPSASCFTLSSVQRVASYTKRAMKRPSTMAQLISTEGWGIPNGSVNTISPSLFTTSPK